MKSDFHDNLVYAKAFAFGVRVIKLYEFLSVNSTRKEYNVSKQLVRSGTSVGANVKEALNGQTKADFAAKMAIANKEAGESEHWIELLQATDYLTKEQADSLLLDCRELCKMLNAICRTSFESIGKRSNKEKI